jgi:hypothetical protein
VEYRKCDQEGCDEPAIYTCVWMKQQYYCTEHLLRVVALGDFMGYPVPKNTVRFIAAHEAFIETKETE